ncbi:MAG TPA: YlxR family protein [Actinotalea sp.]
MSRSARLDEAGPRVRLPERAPDGAHRAVDPSLGPVRTCVGCRGRGLRSALLRVVQVDDGTGSPRAEVDRGRSRPGRGAWLHPDLTCLDLAERRRAFPRALRVAALDITPVREHLEAGASGG